MKFDHVKNLPLQKFEILATRTREVSFIEVRTFRMLKVTREIRSCVWELVAFISYKQIVSSTESWAIRFEAANRLILQRFYKRIFCLISY